MGEVQSVGQRWWQEWGIEDRRALQLGLRSHSAVSQWACGDVDMWMCVFGCVYVYVYAYIYTRVFVYM